MKNEMVVAFFCFLAMMLICKLSALCGNTYYKHSFACPRFYFLFQYVGVYGLSNSLLDTPWKKLQYGKQLFTDVIKQSQDLTKEDLVKELIKVMNNQEP